MIYDKIRNIGQYKGISENLDKAIEFLYNIDLMQLNDGKIEVDGDKVFANVMCYHTKSIEDSVKEAHRNYMDIHIVISGKEKMEVSEISDLEILTEYVEENDIAFYKGEMSLACVLKDDYFLLCFPNDVHTPALKVDESEYIKKMVVKVKI